MGDSHPGEHPCQELKESVPCLGVSVRDNKDHSSLETDIQRTVNSDQTPAWMPIFGKIIYLQPSISVSSAWHTLIRITSPGDNADGRLDDCVSRIDCVSSWQMFYLCSPWRCWVNRGEVWKLLWILFQFALAVVNDMGNCVRRACGSLHPIDWGLNTQEWAVGWVAV